ncbi:putative glutathione-dependent formaldehyde-activating enzyme [Xylariomycetidae sp. FL2044]|nr:putative glutathione-dependent formaldehyde-activating enzyme [Xylariomycetidae sp. FL2044]
MKLTSLHPLIDNGIKKGSPSHAGGKLYCHCAVDPVEVTLTTNVAHNHACGCSKCWKPAGSLFSVVGVVPVSALSVTAHGSKLSVVDPAAAIRRHACAGCGVHMYGRIETEHPFRGLDFVHAELGGSKEGEEGEGEGWQEPQFAAFVSSIIEQGFDPAGMDEVRQRLKGVGLETYDCLAPALMDLIATYTAKKLGTL